MPPRGRCEPPNSYLPFRALSRCIDLLGFPAKIPVETYSGVFGTGDRLHQPSPEVQDLTLRFVATVSEVY